MPELVPMPKLGFDMAEGTLVRKVKKDGEPVKKGDVLAEIETDKATVEVESPAEGVVKGWVVEEGQPVPVGALMAVIGAADEQVDVKALAAQSTNGEAGAQTKAAAEDVPQGGAMGKVAPEQAAAPSPADTQDARAVAGADGQTQPRAEAPAANHAAPAAAAPPAAAPTPGAPASPIARKMADDAGVDVGQIPGTGPGGRITKRDVENYLKSPRPAAPAEAPSGAPAAAPAAAPDQAPTPAKAAAPVAVSTEDQSIPLTRMRQIIARRMTESTTTVPQFYVSTEIDMTAALALRQQLNTLVPEERKLSVNDLIVKAVAVTLREFPNLNASFAGDKVVRKGRVNIGIAVALDNGLLTVVVKDADIKAMSQIAAETKAMVGRAREGKVQPADIEGSTFSISNLGMFNVDHFIAIVNPPEAAILAVGSAQSVPVVKDGAIVVGQRMLATISADHRVTDGAEAARFMQALKHKLEEPLRMVV
jgi:pyruvate dehydrogenase E2 component (dihydrolipoamide acetyltransferase)